jgi:hypothetical protein
LPFRPARAAAPSWFVVGKRARAWLCWKGERPPRAAGRRHVPFGR